MTEVQLQGIEAVEGWLRGPVRTPRNRASSEWQARRGPDAAGRPGRAGGNIHDDATAQKLGFRGGTIAGSIHLDQFPPVVIAAFGQRWFEEGSISLQFRNATIDAEPVVAMVRLPDGPAPQVEARMDRADGMLVADGTAGCGGTEQTYLDAIDLRPAAPDELRLLAGVRPGSALTGRTFTVDSAAQRERIEQGAITEPLGWYTGPSPWGPPIVNPSAIVQLIRNGRDDFGPHIADAVGLFSAIELRFHAGPLRCDTEYRVSGEIVSVGASPKTEYVWYDSRATAGTGEVAVSMRMQLRWMKASSPLYADG
ncbi:MAG: hypothetical protein ACRDYB_09515 [Acidimicrobiales bacterium]